MRISRTDFHVQLNASFWFFFSSGGFEFLCLAANLSDLVCLMFLLLSTALSPAVMSLCAATWYDGCKRVTTLSNGWEE